MVKLLAILRFIWHSSLLLGVGLIGGTVTAAGVVMLVTPGPGLVVIVAGLAILATQFAWAERALDKVKQKAIAARDKASARRADRRAAAAGAPGPQDVAGEVRPSEPVDINIAETRAAEGRAAEGRSVEHRVADPRGAETRAAESRAAESRAADSRAAESRAAESRAAESRAAESRAAEHRVAEQRDADSGLDHANGTKSTEPRAPESRPPETRTNGSHSVESRSAGAWSSESDHQATA